MKNSFPFFFFSAFIFFSCSKEDDNSHPPTDSPAALPVACFTINKYETADSSELFSFTNCSQNAVRYEWDFGDASYAPIANPIHYYWHNGIYIVRMNAYNSDDVMSSFVDTITIGYYSLDKIIYKQATTRFGPPFNLRLLRTSYFDVTATLFSQSDLPLIVQLTDSSIYDINSATVQYTYREDSLPSALLRVFWVSPSQIINYQFDTALSWSLWDTAKFSLHYKIVSR